MLEAARHLERARVALDHAANGDRKTSGKDAPEVDGGPELELLRDEVVDVYRRTIGLAYELGAPLPGP